MKIIFEIVRLVLGIAIGIILTLMVIWVGVAVLIIYFIWRCIVKFFETVVWVEEQRYQRVVDTDGYDELKMKTDIFRMNQLN